MNKVRLGIIGLGNIGQHHFGYLTAGKVSRAEVVAVSDAVPAKLEKYKPLKTFTDGEELIRSGLVDAVIIATPHYQHTTLGIAALKQGLHVMVEKPISAHKADAERLIAAHQQHPEAGVCRHVPTARGAALPEDSEADPERRAGRDRAHELDHDRLVSHGGVLRQRRLARDLEGRGRRRAAQPMPAQPRRHAMAAGHAGPRARLLPARALPPDRGRGQRLRLPRIPQRRHRHVRLLHRRSARHQPVRDRRHARQAGARSGQALLHAQRGRHARVQPDGQARLCQAGGLERRNPLRERRPTPTPS